MRREKHHEQHTDHKQQASRAVLLSAGLAIAAHLRRDDDHGEEVEALQGKQHAWGSNPSHAVESCSAVATNATTRCSTQWTVRRAGRALRRPSRAWLPDGSAHGRSGHHQVPWRVERARRGLCRRTRMKSESEGVVGRSRSFGVGDEFAMLLECTLKCFGPIGQGAPPQGHMHRLPSMYTSPLLNSHLETHRKLL